MTMQEEDIMSSEGEEDIPTLVPIVGTKRKIQTDDSKTLGEDAQETRKKLLRLTKKPKAPTAEELNRLRETENLFHSNMFRLQIEEMIKELKPKAGALKRLTKWSNMIAKFLRNLESDETVYNLADDSWVEKARVRLPLQSDIAADSKTSFQFLKPAAVTEVGSVPAGCGFKPSPTLDLAVEMPKRMLHKGDHLNERYWHKKLAYLTVLASRLHEARSELSILSVEFRSTAEPALYWLSVLVTPLPDICKKMKLNILAVPEAKAIKLSRCYPQACNIRPSWLRQAPESDEQEEASGEETPQYNTLLARDVSLLENDAYRRRCFEQGGEAMRDAYLLLCVWLQQRDLCHGVGTLSRSALSLYLCRLLTSRHLHASMSSYQMLRNVWVRLASAGEDWTSNVAGEKLPGSKAADEKPPGSNATGDKSPGSNATGDTFHRYFPVVLVDETGLQNLAASMTEDYYKLLKEEARIAVSCLDDVNLDSFSILFMTPSPFLRQFDHYMSFSKRDKVQAALLKQEGERGTLDRGQGRVARFANRLVEFLKENLGERLAALSYRTYPTQVCTGWGEHHKEGEGEDGEGSCLVVGIRLNSETCFKLIHRGPEANLPEAAGFRAVWGSRAELRRFKDGQVCEAAVWGAPGVSWRGRRLVTRTMVEWLLGRHWGLERGAGDYEYLSDEAEQAVQELEAPAGSKKGDPAAPGLGSEEATLAVLSVWDTLARGLRDMTGLALDILSVWPVAPVLRYTDPRPPRPCYQPGPLSLHGALPPLVKPVEGVIEVTASGKWPEDLQAIARLKAALYLELSDRLETQHILTRVDPHHLDVYQGGYVFRLRLYCASEVTQLKKQIQDGVVRYKNSASSVALQQQLVSLPLLHSALHGLHQAHPVLGPGVCLAKRWLACQLLLGPASWPHPPVELLAASLLGPAPGPAPLCPQAFLWRFLALLATHNFLTDPVLVNPGGDLSRNEILHVEARMRNDRGTLPALVLLTPWDPSAQLWSREAPDLATLVRTVALARASLRLAESNLLRGQSLKPIFEFPRADFDFLISVNRSAVSKVCAAGGPEVKLKQMPVVDFNPIEAYVTLLQESYGDLFLFLYDVYGGLEIGVVTKPDTVQGPVEQRLKARRVGGGGALELNLGAALEDFYILGRGLVRAVTCRTRGLIPSPFRPLGEGP